MTIELRGAQVYCEQHGEGKPVLLLHGWGGSADSWLPLIRDLQADRRVIAVDFPGFGNRSPEPPEPWDVRAYMEMTAQFIRAAGIGGADIICHSFGARVAIMLAAEHPDLVGRLVMTGAAGLIAPASGAQSGKRNTYQKLRALADNSLTRAVLGENNVEKMRNALRQRYGSEDYRAIKTDRMRATFNRIIAQDLSEYLPRISASTLLIYGDRDTSTPLWMGQKMEQLIPDAGLVVFEGAGHFAYLDQYPRFLAIVQNFLPI